MKNSIYNILLKIFFLVFFLNMSVYTQIWQYVGSAGGYTQIVFATEKIGWAFNTDIQKTIDGGKTFYKVNISPTYFNGYLRPFFLNQYRGWLGAKSDIYFTDDGGSIWTKQNCSDNIDPIFYVKFFDDNNGYVVRGYGSPASIYRSSINKTTDGGQTWTTTIMDSVHLSQAFFLDNQTGWVAGATYKNGNVNDVITIVLRTTNGGASWEKISNASVVSTYNNLFFTSKDIGWGRGNPLIKTTDGGITWVETTNSLFTGTVNKVFFSTSNIGYVSTSGGIYKTTNGGENWKLQSVPQGYDNLTDFSLVNPNSMWLITTLGAVCKYYGEVALTAPNGGEVWSAGSQQQITWTNTNLDTVALQYSTDNGNNWISITTGTYAKNNSYTWTIPITLSTLCKVRIVDNKNSGVADTSDNVFTISNEPVLTLTSPNGSETWQVGSTQNITWTSTNVTNVKLEYTTNNGTDWATIIASTPASSGSYAWTVPNTPSTQCKVRATDLNNTALFDVSDTTFTISDGNWIVYNTTNSSLPHNSIKSIAVDNAGIKWIGTENGLAKYDGTNWTIYTTANSSLPYNYVSAITVDTAGNKWIGTFSRYLAKFDNVNWTVYNTNDWGLPIGAIQAIAIDAAGNKWIGTTEGLAKFDGTTGTIYTPSNSGLPYKAVQSIAIDEQGNKWIGTLDSGLVKYDGTNWTVYKTTNSQIPNNQVHAIAISRYGNKWLGTTGGFARYDGSNWNVYDRTADYLDNWVFAAAIDNSGNKWTGSMGGVGVLDSTNWVSYRTTNSGLPDSRINTIAIDGSDNKWFGTNAGGVAVLKAGTILSKTLTLLAPNGSENWQAGTTQNITWNSSNVSNIKLEYTTNSGTNWNTLIASTPASSGSYAWTVPNTTAITCKVRISDVSNNDLTDKSDNVFTITKIVAAPTNLTASAGNKQVTFKWNKNSETDLRVYRIYGGTSANPTNKVDSITYLDTTKTIFNLTNGTKYFYRITAVDSSGNESGFSNEVNATPQGISTKLDQAYVPVTTNMATGRLDKAQTFTVGESGTLVKVDLLMARQPGATADLLFDIRRTTSGKPNTDDAATLVSLRIPAQLVPETEGNYYSIDFSSKAFEVTAGEALAIVIRSYPDVESYTWWGKTTDNGYLNGHHYFRHPPGWPRPTWYADVAGTDMGFRTYLLDTTVPDITAPSAPTALTAIGKDKAIDLTWKKNSESDVKVYRIYGGTSANPITKIDSVNYTDTTFTHSSIQNNITYFYRITAVDSTGNQSAYSNEVSETPNETVTYGGKTYHTVKIGTQTWLRENLDIGTMIQGNVNTTNNVTIEKYCYDNSPANCDTYGGFYQWNEAMAYNTTPGTQGICPTGWHIPTQTEFQTLATAVSNDGNALKAVGQGTGSGTGTNTSGFSALLAGSRYLGNFITLGSNANLWSSTIHSTSMSRYTFFSGGGNSITEAYTDANDNGFSVRCVKDESPIASIQITSPNGGESLVAGTVDTIMWTSTNVTNVKLEYTTNSGTDWSTIIASTPASAGSYAWLIPTLSSPNCKARISDVTNSLLVDTSDNIFSINYVNGYDSITYGGKIYHTVKIGNQTWLKENLDIGTMIQGNVNATNNGTIEKYCYDNNPANCATYGGLYQWNEAMAYSTTPGSKGICPDGWHIPTSTEFDTLATFVKNDANALKTVGQGTGVGTGTNTSGFSALLAGYRDFEAYFNGLGDYVAYFWSSTEHDAVNGDGIGLYYDNSNINMYNGNKGMGFSVRCLKNESPTATIQITTPNGGERWKGNSSQQITWGMSGGKSAVGSSQSAVGSSQSAVLNRQWAVGKGQKVIGQESVVSDEANGLSGKLKVKSGKLNLDSDNLELTTNNSIENVRIDYSTNNGTNWTTVVSSVPASQNSYAWLVPKVNSLNCKVRVVDQIDTTITDTSDAVFEIYSPQITVTSPNGGEQWQSGSTHAITWTQSNTDTVKISYSTNQGTGWIPIAEKPASEGIYSWVVPSTISSTCKVKISDKTDSTFADSSNAVFAITSIPVVQVLVTSPNGGENWKVGSAQNITWTSSNVSKFKIEYKIDNTGSWTQVGYASSSPYSWNIPNTISSQCKVRISDSTNTAISDSSDAVFTIFKPTLTVVYPNGGEELQVGSNINVTWLSSNVQNVAIEYSTTNKRTWSSISASVAASNQSISWTVPDTVSDSCFIRIKNVSDNSVADTSDAKFKIIPSSPPSLTLTSPVGNEQWKLGTKHFITWTKNKVTTVKIEFSSNDGNSWSTLTSTAVADSGKYEWTVPNSASAVCRIKISDAANSQLNSVSTLPFEIYYSEIVLTAPNGGEEWMVSETHAITWTSLHINKVKVELTTDNGANWIVEKDSTTASIGTVSWIIPNHPSINCKIRVRDVYDLNVGDTSEQVFTIKGLPKLQVLSPKAGDVWEVGTTKAITWYRENIEQIKIELSTNSGTDWMIITSSVQASDQSYSWEVQNYLSQNCLVRISDVANPSFSDTSDIFSIVTKVKPIVLTPNGGEKLTLGQLYDVIWKLGSGKLLAPKVPSHKSGNTKGKFESLETAATSNIRILLSTDDGVSWAEIKNQIAVDSAKFTWTVSGEPSDKCFIKIVDINDASNFDLSDSAFVILDNKIPNILVSTNSLDFENVYQDSTEIKQINISNTGTADLQIQSTSFYQTSSAYKITTFNQTIKPDSTRNVSISFKPTELISYSDTLYVYHNAAGSPAKIVLTGSGIEVPKPIIEIAATTVTFDTTYIGSNNQKTIAIDNEGTAPLIVSKISFDKVVFSSPQSSFTLGAGLRHILTLNFAPTSDSSYSGMLSIQHNAAGSPNSVSLVGQGKKHVPNIVLSSKEINFGVITVYTHTEVTLDINNSGTADLFVSNISSSNNSFATNLTNFVVQPNSSRAVTLTFSPINATQYTGTLTIAHNAGAGVSTVSMAGAGYPVDVIVTRTISFGDITLSGNYRMVGLPGDSSISISKTVSGTQKNDWNAFYDNGVISANQSDYLKEYDGSAKFTFKPGNGFWVVSKNGLTVSANVKPVPLAADSTYSIPLQSNWNIISNPFEKSTSWTKIKQLNSLTTHPLYKWNGQNYDQVSEMTTYEGFYFYNTAGLTWLKIPYDANGTLKKFFKSREEYQLGEKGFSIDCRQEGIEKSSVYAGFNSMSSNDVDDYDYFMPPADFGEVSLVLQNDSLSTNYKKLLVEQRKEIGEGTQFDFTAKNNSKGEVQLTINGIEFFPESETYLLDKQYNKFTSLKEKNVFTLPQQMGKRNYALLVGSQSFIQERKAAIIPTEYLLYQNFPNPFNPATTIAFGLPKESNVTLTLYNMLGEVVLKNELGEKASGYHELLLDLRSNPSGVYFYAIHANALDGSKNFREVKKMMLLK